eukprot:TRINITY_DN58114_c0_g1_i1.p1 TRINITY_DN58114_c0_g1~~TRINITY_DN58114_c0_g1_i1.p1  ORF type:complete len:242 (-),score=35.65 TRINITY_DN58114_c0_g1_i1:252-929(-)
MATSQQRFDRKTSAGVGAVFGGFAVASGGAVVSAPGLWGLLGCTVFSPPAAIYLVAVGAVCGVVGVAAGELFSSSEGAAESNTVDRTSGDESNSAAGRNSGGIHDTRLRNDQAEVDESEVYKDDVDAEHEGSWSNDINNVNAVKHEGSWSDDIDYVDAVDAVDIPAKTRARVRARLRRGHVKSRGRGSRNTDIVDEMDEIGIPAKTRTRNRARLQQGRGKWKPDI